MRLLSLAEVLHLHRRVLATSGGSGGVRDAGALLSALAQPNLTFDGEELYPDVIAKAAALCHSLVANHPFVDGNKRIGHAAMEVVLVLNGLELDEDVNEQERAILSLASGEVSRDEFIDWVRARTRQQGTA